MKGIYRNVVRNVALETRRLNCKRESGHRSTSRSTCAQITFYVLVLIIKHTNGHKFV